MPTAQLHLTVKDVALHIIEAVARKRDVQTMLYIAHIQALILIRLKAFLYSTLSISVPEINLFIYLSSFLGEQFRMTIPEVLADDIVVDCSWYKFNAFHLFAVSW